MNLEELLKVAYKAANYGHVNDHHSYEVQMQAIAEFREVFSPEKVYFLLQKIESHQKILKEVKNHFYNEDAVKIHIKQIENFLI